MLSSCSDWRYSAVMDWVAFIPSVVAGSLAGTFFVRSRFWKQRYGELQRIRMAEEDIHRTEFKSVSKSLTEYREAYEDMVQQHGPRQAAAANHHHQPVQFAYDQLLNQQLVGPKMSDGVLQKILVDLNAQPKTHVIEEEP